MKTYGRKTIYVNLSEKELLSADIETQKKMILSVFPSIVSIYKVNRAEVEYLWDYYLGMQDIKDKVKFTREEINNKRVENWAYAIVDFKKNWILGKPIQYVMLNDSSSDEIETLNKYVRYEGKASKDQDLYEDILVTGRGFRYNNADEISDDDEAPFEIENIDREHCEVIYSNRIGHEQLFTIVETDMQEKVLNVDKNVYEPRYYSIFTIYTRKNQFTLQYKSYTTTMFDFIDVQPIVANEHLITEWHTNRDRISLIEIGKDLFDGINKIESLDMDDMEQFVNAIMVFTNAEVDENELSEIKRLGAVNIKSTENKKASIDLLQGRLNATETQTMYTRQLVALYQILGIPMATDTGSVTSGDTGKAKLTGQGFTSAGIRANGDETQLSECDRKSLKTLLKICRSNSKSDISDLKASDVDIKFNVDMSENLLVKTQALLNLLNSDIPREYALPIINLFSDPTAVIKKAEERFGEQASQMGAKKEGEEENSNPTEDNMLNADENTDSNNSNVEPNTSNTNLSNAQNNKMTSIIENDTQGK